MPRKSELTGILRRGSACLSCRRRKLRCDGIRPVCDQCTTMKRPHECVYDDSARKSRTQTLREKLYALEAKVRELEYQPGSSKHPSAISLDGASGSSSSSPSFSPFPELQSYTQMDSSIGGSLWHSNNSSSSLFSTIPTSLPLDNLFDAFGDSSNSSPSHSDKSFSPPLNVAAPLYRHTNLLDDCYDSFPERGEWNDGPNISLAPEIPKALVQTFIAHRKQYCFYTDINRLETSPSGTVYQQAPPSGCLMSTVYLLGSFFTRTLVLPEGLEQRLLEHALHEVTRSLHNQEQLLDVVQALSLLAQYFFFNSRDMEGNRQLMAAKRIAVELGLHTVTPPDFSVFPFDLEYPFAEASGIIVPSTAENSEEKAAIWWQLFMVETFWSAASSRSAITLPDVEIPCRNITTPLPVVVGARMEATMGNTSIGSLFSTETDSFQANCMSVTGLKVMAASVFHRSLRAQNVGEQDSTAWATYRSAEIALQRLICLVPEFTWKNSMNQQNPTFDTDLYMVQTLILASTIQLQVDQFMNVKFSMAAKKLIDLLNFLNADDYFYLDPVLAICWASIIDTFRCMIDSATAMQSSAGMGANFNYAIMFLRRCVDTLLSAVRNMSGCCSLAAHILPSIEEIPVSSTPFDLHTKAPSYYMTSDAFQIGVM